MKRQQQSKRQQKQSDTKVSNWILCGIILATGLIVTYYCAWQVLTFGSKLVWIHLQEGYFECVGFASHASYTDVFEHFVAQRAELYVNGTAVQQIFYTCPTILKILFYGVSWFVYIQTGRILVAFLKRKFAKKSHSKPERKTR